MALVDGKLFTCSNRQFETNTDLGFEHGHGHAKGSVFDVPLAGDPNEYSLWLEHVVSRYDGSLSFWLMWYNNGNPTIPMSGVMDAEDLKRIGHKLIDQSSLFASPTT